MRPAGAGLGLAVIADEPTWVMAGTDIAVAEAVAATLLLGAVPQAARDTVDDSALVAR